MEAEQLKQHKKHFSTIGLIFFACTLVIMGVQLGAAALGGLLPEETFEKYNFVIMMLPMYFVGGPIVYFITKSIPVSEPIEKKSMSVKALLGFFTVGYAGMYIANIFGNMLASIIGMLKQSGVVDNDMTTLITGNELWVNFLVVAILAPIMEEMWFRKLLLDRTHQYGEKVAIIMSALFFALYHGNIFQFCYAFVLGCVFGYVYLKSGKVLYTIILHMIINFMGSIVSVLALRFSNFDAILSNPDMDQAQLTETILSNLGGLAILGTYFLVVIAIVLVGVLVFALNVGKIKLNPGTITLPKGKVFSTMYLNFGVILFSLLWVIMIIIATLK